MYVNVSSRAPVFWIDDICEHWTLNTELKILFSKIIFEESKRTYSSNINCTYYKEALIVNNRV